MLIKKEDKMITSIFAKSNPEKILIQHIADARCVAIEIFIILLCKKEAQWASFLC